MEGLYRFEVKGIQEFILSTNKLKEIKGGSRLISALSEIFIDTLSVCSEGSGYYVLTNAAGGATVRFVDEEDSRALMQIWPIVVHHLAPTLQVIQASVPWRDGLPMPYSELQRALQRARNQLWPSLPEGTPLTYRSPSTGLPAERLLRSHQESRRLDRGAYYRSKLGTDGKLDKLSASIDPTIEWAANFEDDLTYGRLAVIHIDGNDLGLKIRSLTEFASGSSFNKALSTFSRALSNVTECAAIEAFAQIKREAEREEIWTKERPFPARFIVIGGDDITLIIDGRLAHRYVESYLREFERLSLERADELGGGLTACAGLVEVKSSWPFSQACELAESLCRFCKSHLRGRLSGQTPSALAWHRVTTSMVGDFEHEVLQYELAGDSNISLSAGPYTLSDVQGFVSLSKLQTLVEALKSPKLPKSSVRRCLSYLKTDYRLARDRWKRIKEISVKSEEEKRRLAWERVAEAMNDLGVEGEELVIKTHERGLVTPLADALSLIRAEGGNL